MCVCKSVYIQLYVYLMYVNVSCIHIHIYVYIHILCECFLCVYIYIHIHKCCCRSNNMTWNHWDVSCGSRNILQSQHLMVHFSDWDSFSMQSCNKKQCQVQVVKWWSMWLWMTLPAIRLHPVCPKRLGAAWKRPGSFRLKTHPGAKKLWPNVSKNKATATPKLFPFQARKRKYHDV